MARGYHSSWDTLCLGVASSCGSQNQQAGCREAEHCAHDESTHTKSVPSRPLHCTQAIFENVLGHEFMGIGEAATSVTSAPAAEMER